MPRFIDILKDNAADLIACLRFYSRLPIPVFAFEAAPYAMLDFQRSIRMLPVAGAILGAIGALALWLAHAAGLSPLAASGLALAVLLLTTGAFHEDGLADTADGLGGGATIERKLEIMKDSRIGTYGGAALITSSLLRVVLMADVLQQSGPWAAALALVAAAAASRTAALLPLALLDPARRDGAAYAAMKPSSPALAVATVAACLFCLAPLMGGASPGRILLAAALMVGGALAMTEIARRLIGGHTGDVAGASQQVGEIAFLCAMASRAAL
jgi:adenosylcobinamide-GDP ribazoletransferase